MERNAKMERCKVFILAGGEGTRLRPLTLTRPKSMIPLGQKPVIENLITQISKSGFTSLVITLNYLKEQVMHYIGDGSRLGVKVDYAIEPEGVFLGTAGGVKLAAHLLTETFVVVQGDAYTTIDLAKALDFHRRLNADATIILKEVLDPWLYGVVVCDSNGRISAFQEKPQKGQERSNLVNTGIYCLDLEILDLITSRECDFAKNVFPQLLDEEKRLFGFIGEGSWVDVGSLRGYLEGTRLVLEDSYHPDYILIGKNTAIDETANIKGSTLIEDNVSIGEDSQIGPYAVLKNGVKVGEKTTIQNATILEHATLGSQCKIQESVIGEQATLANSVIVDGSIIGPGSILEESVQVKDGSRIWPSVRVDTNTLVQGTLVLPTEKPFYFYSEIGKYTGVTASTILELVSTIQKVGGQSVEFHLYNRDFERWIRDVFQANMLVARIASIRKEALKGEELRKKLISTIEDWYEYSIELAS